MRDTTTTAADTGTLLPRALTWPLLLAGPAATVAAYTTFVPDSALGTLHSPAVLWLLLIGLWSPLFFSIPALLTQDARDRALPHLGGAWWHPGNLIRGVALIPWLLFSPQSTVRAETALGLVGFVTGVAWAAPWLF